MNLSPDVSPATTDKIDSSPDSDLSVPAPQPNPSAARQRYESCVLDADGKCTRWSHDHFDDFEATNAPGFNAPVVPSARVDLDLDQIEARANAATHGPWRVHFSDAQKADHIRSAGAEWVAQFAATRDDAEFIAHAREDVPRLVAEVRRLRGVADAALAELDRSLEARDRRAEAERDAARAEADDLRRQLLDETYRPEGGEIVLRELRRTQRERDDARAKIAAIKPFLLDEAANDSPEAQRLLLMLAAVPETAGEQP